MNNYILLTLGASLVASIVIFCLKETQPKLRNALSLCAALSVIFFLSQLIYAVYYGQQISFRYVIVPGIDFVLDADALSLFFASLSGLLWFVTTIYAIGYFRDSSNLSRFFGFFSLCVFSTFGIAFAGNLLTFLIFYELLTLVTYPLVIHRGTPEALQAGKKYLIYTVLGGTALLTGIVWLKTIGGSLDFVTAGHLSLDSGISAKELTFIFVLVIAGLGVKAAFVPFHGWLPVSMVAPAPVSALLHAVAVVKAGVFGIVRVVYDVYGIELCQTLNLHYLLAIFAAVTIVYGSIRALYQDDLKRRLAFSTVSQLSYIVLGAALLGPIATIGGIVHLVHQGLMKITLFFCAGNLAETLGIHKISEMSGVGKRMPITMTAFTIAALGMIGMPPLAGFISKWYLGLGAVYGNAYWASIILSISSILNAYYFLPIIYKAWFQQADTKWPTKLKTRFFETSKLLLLPPVTTTCLLLVSGLFAGSLFSPVNWAEIIAYREYGFVVESVLKIVINESWLLWTAIFLPMLVIAFMPIKRIGEWRFFLVPLSVLPALWVTVFLPLDIKNEVPWLFLGSVITLDVVAKYCLMFASILWGIAALFSISYLKSDPRKTRFFIYFLLAMTGNFGLILSQDGYGYLTFFTLMSLASYGLIVQKESAKAFSAGKNYIKWAILGEVLLFLGLVWLIKTNDLQMNIEAPDSFLSRWHMALLIFGFGIKAGLMPMHVWLPKAHPVAPVPASAILSGVMVKAGVLGWLKFLPLGQQSDLWLGSMMLILGFTSTFMAAVLGAGRENPKEVLAYSTISQLGIISAIVGLVLIKPETYLTLMPVIIFYMFHHGIMKAILFLSAGLTECFKRSKVWSVSLWVTIAFAALSLIGAPFTSGAIAKSSLKAAIDGQNWLILVISFTAVATSCLMASYISALNKQSSENSNLAQAPDLLQIASYGLLVLFGVGFLFILPIVSMLDGKMFKLVSVTELAFAIAIGGGISFLIIKQKQHFSSFSNKLCQTTLAVFAYSRNYFSVLLKQGDLIRPKGFGRFTKKVVLNYSNRLSGCATASPIYHQVAFLIVFLILILTYL